MPRETEPRRKPVPRPLLPPALRRPAALLLAGCAAVTVSLALAFTHQARPGWLDAGVDARIRGGLGGYQRPVQDLASLGGQGSVTVLTAALVLACLTARRWRGAVLAGGAGPPAGAPTRFLPQPPRRAAPPR